MKLKLLMIVGAIAPSFVFCTTGVTAERHSDIVIAQGSPASTTEKDKNKPQPPAGQVKRPQQPAAQPPAHKPVVQQPPVQHPVQKPVVQQPPVQHPVQKPVVQQQPLKPQQPGIGANSETGPNPKASRGKPDRAKARVAAANPNSPAKAGIRQEQRTNSGRAGSAASGRGTG